VQGELQISAREAETYTYRHDDNGFTWEQVNAPAHGPGFDVIKERFRSLNWPWQSPDLAPTEIVCSILKRALIGWRFNSQRVFFDAIEIAWWEIDQRALDHLVSSFRARCKVCLKLGGANLNGHWMEVHLLHHANDPATIPPEPDSVDE
jgi:hypothetical protein